MKQLIMSFALIASYSHALQLPASLVPIYKNIEPWKHVDFDVSMELKRYPSAIAVTQRVIGVDGDQLLSLFRDLFNRYNLSIIAPQDRPSIPKIIHQIWLGGDVPEAFERLMQTWTEMHLGRGWRYKLWTDKDVASFGLTNQRFYDQTDNYGVKSDILKWEIIYRYGGVYVDVDYECLRPLDVLHHTYDFYTGIQPLDTQYVQLGAALFGAHPKHPILKHCIETIANDWEKQGAPAKTGPVHFTRSFFATAGKHGKRDIALPPSYLYPLGCRQKEINYDAWYEGGAYAIHHWAKSWMPTRYRPKQFRQLNNDASCESWND